MNCSECAGVFCVACTHIVAIERGQETTSKSTKKGKNKEQKDDDDAADDTPVTTTLSKGGNSSSSRVCDGCKRMETPGEEIREAIKEELKSEIARLEKKNRKKEAKTRPAMKNQFEETLDRASMNLAVKVADTIGKAGMELPPVVPLLLHRGSAFSMNGEENDEYDDRRERMRGTTPPRSGYLEITNKSAVFFCIKVLYSAILDGGRDSDRIKFEVPRPSYIAVPPGGTVHAFFDEKQDEKKRKSILVFTHFALTLLYLPLFFIPFCPSIFIVPVGIHGSNDDEEQEEDSSCSLDIMILYDNPKEGKKKKSTSKIQYETHRHVDTANISPIAKVSLFRSVIVYTIRANDQNMILKYKGKGMLVPRKGNNLMETGLVNVLLGRRTVGDIDLSTNVLSVGSTSYRLSV